MPAGMGRRNESVGSGLRWLFFERRGADGGFWERRKSCELPGSHHSASCRASAESRCKTGGTANERCTSAQRHEAKPEKG
jgi:hypothetical protein